MDCDAPSLAAGFCVQVAFENGEADTVLQILTERRTRWGLGLVIWIAPFSKLERAWRPQPQHQLSEREEEPPPPS